MSVKGLISIILMATISLIGLIAPLIIPPEAATAVDMTARLAPPSWKHPFGTDKLGRDLFIRVLLGTQLSLEIAVTAMVMSLLIGLPLGMVSGFAGGRVDNVLMRFVDTLLAFPALLLALTISAVLGPNIQNTIIAIGIAFTLYLAHIVRGEALPVPYVEAPRAAGTTDLPILTHHVLPNILPAVIVQATISIAFAILAEAGLSFLGLGSSAACAKLGADDSGVARLA